MLGSLPFLAVAVVTDVVRHFDAGDRRLRTVERDPRQATADDVELLVRAHGTPEGKVWWVTDRMEAADLEPAQVWAWTMKHDGIALAELLGSAVTDAELLQMLSHRANVAGLRAA